MRESGVAEAVRRPSRLEALAAIGANAVTSAEALDRIASTACRVLDVQVALVNIVGADRQRFVGCGGGEPWRSIRDMPVSQGFCPFVLAAGESYTLQDARDEFAHDPAVAQLGVVAYAGVPLRAAGGEPIGTLCALDSEPRDWSEDDLRLLADLAAGVIAELQLLTATRVIARQQARLRTLTGLSSALAPAQDPGDVSDEVIRALDRFDAILEAVPDVGSVAVLPLTAGDQHLGALGVCFADERPFSDDDREYLAALGGVSGLALARAPR